MMGRTRKRGSILFSEFGVARTRTSLSAPFTCHSSRVCVPTTSPEAQLRWHSVRVALFLWLSPTGWVRSEEHTSELQSHSDLVCRLLLEKKKRYRPLRVHREP